MDRALACAASCWLPESPEPGQPHPSALRGTRIHKALERSFLTAREADIFHGLRPDDLPLAKKAIAGRPYVAPISPLFPMLEVECWWNPLTLDATLGSANGDENDDQAVPYGWWRGRADVLGRTRTDALMVLDHKTGSPRHQTPAARSAQLMFFASFLASHPDTAPEVDHSNGVFSAVYLTQKGELDKHWAPLHASPEQKAQAEQDKAWADIAEFQEKAAALEAKLQIVEAGGPEADRVIAENPPVLNKGCFFCPCKAACPTYQESKNNKERES